MKTEPQFRKAFSSIQKISKRLNQIDKILGNNMPIIRSPFEQPELRKELRSGIKLLPHPIQAAVTKAALKDPKNLENPNNSNNQSLF